MRKILLGFLTLLMLTPVLTCAMVFCPMQDAQAAGGQPCHAADDGTLVLALDCMGIDLFQQNVSNDTQPDPSGDTIEYAWADLITDYGSQSNNVNSIRGPPDQGERASIGLSLILTTQRIRI